jgi:dGTP triphosphohydrolase
MQLESLLTSLGIPQFIRQLSEFRDDLLREKAAELKELADSHAEAMTDAETAHVAELKLVKTELAERDNLIESAKNAIKGAIADQSLDDTTTVATIARVVAIAELPAIEKRKLEISAEIAKKQAELDALTVEQIQPELN